MRLARRTSTPLLLAVTLGCTQQAEEMRSVSGFAHVSHSAPAPSREADPAQTGPALQTPGTDSAAEEVSLQLMTWDETQQLIATQRGKVVVLDLWATSCVPCRREFPSLVQLHRDFGDRVACVSFSTDYTGRASKPPESYREQVLEYLTQQGATFLNVLGTDDPDELSERLKLPPIPAVYVYDQQGKLSTRFDNTDRDREEFTYEKDVIPFVRQLLDGSDQT